ncbi:hypothetical protein C4F40_19870 [Sphingobacterium sp. Ka21]|uniref:Signal transduction histidine kinase dimerisation/phosphoacceptor domain-containing protein n=2 Tax=Sphingobacterium pedocola TaxID=2082722 RepID=A0ABR9TC90_9SPHI|nr:hypothetical protein [Sphingobacterium pedocola]
MSSARFYGVLRWYQLNILPYYVRNENRTDGSIITFVDIAQRTNDIKKQEKLMAEHTLLLETIAHDLKNQILGISLSLQPLTKRSRL